MREREEDPGQAVIFNNDETKRTARGVITLGVYGVSICHWTVANLKI
jgi:hypothetical protein